MLRKVLIVGVVAGLLFSIPAFTASDTQRPDLAGNIVGSNIIAPALYANSAVTSAWVDIANYTSVAFTVAVGLVQQADTSYVVFQDSSSGLAVAAFDSALVGVAQESTFVDMGYYRNRRFVRAVVRASGSAADSQAVAVALIGTQRNR